MHIIRKIEGLFVKVEITGDWPKLREKKVNTVHG